MTSDAPNPSVRTVGPNAILPRPSLEENARIQKYWRDNYQNLLAEYPEHFVAVKGNEVVAAADDLALLYYKLRELGLSPRGDVAIEFVTAKSATLNL